jgi:hypothetical protein
LSKETSHHFSPARYGEFGEYPAQVSRYGPNANFETIGNCLISSPVGDHARHFLLTRAKSHQKRRFMNKQQTPKSADYGIDENAVAITRCVSARTY